MARRSPRRYHLTHLNLQALEDRTAPATILWTNPAGGAWDDPANWDLGRTPEPDDDVVIRTLDFGAVIDHATGADAVQSVSSQLDGGTLAITNSSSLAVTGSIVLPNLAARTGGVVSGNNTGPLTTNLLATDGGVIRFPFVSEYHATIFTSLEADGAGSLIDLPALTSLQASTGAAPRGEVRLDLIADHGGTLDLPALASVVGHPPDYFVGATALRAQNGGTFVFDTSGSITFDAGGSLTVDTGSDVQAGDLVVGDSLTVGGSLEASSLLNRGNATVTGTLTVSGTYTLATGYTELEAGTVYVGDRFDNEGGYLAGSGTILGDVTNAGLFDVLGLTVDGNYTQTTAGQLSLRLRSASDFDQLVVTGFATLDGTLNAILSGGYQPQPGDQLQVVQFGAGTGAFTRIQTGAPLAGVLYVYLPEYGSQPGVTLLF